MQGTAMAHTNLDFANLLGCKFLFFLLDFLHFYQQLQSLLIFLTCFLHSPLLPETFRPKYLAHSFSQCSLTVKH